MYTQKFKRTFLQNVLVFTKNGIGVKQYLKSEEYEVITETILTITNFIVKSPTAIIK